MVRARKREVITASVAAPVRDKIYQLVREVQEETTIEIHPGIILDAAMKDVTKQGVMQAIGLWPRIHTAEPTHG